MKCQLKDMKVRRGKCKCVILQTLPLYYKLTLCSSDDPIYFIHWLTCKLLEKTLRFWAPCPRNVCRKDWLNQKLFWWSISKMLYYEKYQRRRTGLESMVNFFLQVDLSQGCGGFKVGYPWLTTWRQRCHLAQLWRHRFSWTTLRGQTTGYC